MTNIRFSDTATAKLQSVLQHCIGRNTIKVYVDDDGRFYCTHFNALIAIVEPNKFKVIYNTLYYDYSNSTGRVRNAFVKYFSMVVPLTKSALNKFEDLYYKDEYIHPQVGFISLVTKVYNEYQLRDYLSAIKCN